MFEYKLVIEGIHFNDKESEEFYWDVEDYDNDRNRSVTRSLKYSKEVEKSITDMSWYYSQIIKLISKSFSIDDVKYYNMYDAIRIRIKCNSKEHQLDNKVIAESIIKTR